MLLVFLDEIYWKRERWRFAREVDTYYSGTLQQDGGRSSEGGGRFEAFRQDGKELICQFAENSYELLF